MRPAEPVGPASGAGRDNPAVSATPADAGLEATLEQVLAVVRQLARELGGARAERTVRPEASLEREVGLGSLERVELVARLETALGRSLDEGALRLDTPADLARALLAAPAGEVGHRPSPSATPVAPTRLATVRATTLHGSLWERAEAEPERLHAHVREDGAAERAVTYGDLLRSAAAVAGGLRELGVRRGDTVGLMLPTGFDFLHSFQGALLAGAVPVPVYPPFRLDRLEEHAARQGGILADAGSPVLVTFDRARPLAALLRARAPRLAHVVTASDLASRGTPVSAPDGAGPDTALLQYTSGSTGSPKGVELTHDNLLANIRAIAAGVDLRPTDVGASWLPLYHDMGLIGTWLFCLHLGVPLSLQSPLAFLARPERWLWAIHDHRATLSGAPNFAYELCARRVGDEALEGLDLSCWRCALNGAEPVNPDTLERFCRRFEPHGFRREALLPVYGLAESAVALCFPPLGRPARVSLVRRVPLETEGRAEGARGDEAGATRFVSVGRPLPGHEVRVVDEGGAELPGGRQGRLVFRGPSAMVGYFRQPEATAAISLPGGWLDSGDLGFFLDGELHVSGRRKDLVIKGGRNLVPQEIEAVASEVPGVRRGNVAAFGLPSDETGTERLVVVAETRSRDREERERIVAAVTERIADALGVPPDVVTLAPPGAVPKTPSGKIRRTAAREAWLSGRLGRRPRPLARLVTAARLTAASTAEAASRLPRIARGALFLSTALALVPVGWLAGRLVRGPRGARAVSHLGARLLLRASGCRLAVEGLERLAAAGPALLVANHASYADVPVLLAALPSDVLFVAKKEVLEDRVLAPLVRKAGHLTVDRWDAEKGPADAGRIAEALAAGHRVLVFPEGTFTAAAGLRPFRLGAFKAAVDAGLPVWPVALRGTRAALPDGARVPRPGPVQVQVEEPVAPRGQGWDAVVDLRDRVAEVLAERCGESRLPLVAGGPERP